METKEDRLVFPDELKRIFKITASETIRRWIADGKLPKKDVFISRKSGAWRLSTLKNHGINLI